MKIDHGAPGRYKRIASITSIVIQFQDPLACIAPQEALYRLDRGGEPMRGVSRSEDDVSSSRLGDHVGESADVEVAHRIGKSSL
ncbi:MAG: hypothetical protein O7E52_18895 [Candidatus Poribacteria bacterium]|nr:hypothetical protein [Candidatus Poribacteria bacterium]